MLVSRVPKVKACTRAQPAPLALPWRAGSAAASGCTPTSSPRCRRADQVRPAVRRAPVDEPADTRRPRAAPRAWCRASRRPARADRAGAAAGDRPHRQLSRAMARRAAACSAADICSKSIVRSRSSAEKLSSRRPRSRPRPPPPAPAAAPRRRRRAPRRRAARPPRAPSARSPPDQRREQRHHLLHEPRIAPEEPENLREDLAVLRAAHEAGLQRVVEIPPVGETRRLDRAYASMTRRSRPATRLCAEHARNVARFQTINWPLARSSDIA